MKNLINKYKAWRHEQRRRMGQWYANLIISQLEYSIQIGNEWQFNYWMTQGMMLDAHMIGNYEIYLD